MQMIITERCPFLFADCNFCSHEGKSACQPRKAGARSLEDLPSAKIHNLSDFSKQIKKKYL